MTFSDLTMDKSFLPLSCRGCPLTILALAHETAWTRHRTILIGEKTGIKKSEGDGNSDWEDI
jgi:hypothetical protein